MAKSVTPCWDPTPPSTPCLKQPGLGWEDDQWLTAFVALSRGLKFRGPDTHMEHPQSHNSSPRGPDDLFYLPKAPVLVRIHTEIRN